MADAMFNCVVNPAPAESQVVPLFFDNYLAMIKGSPGSQMFRHFYAEVSGQKTDILQDGELSCAFFASGILRLFDLIKEGHCTVSGTVKDLENSGWYLISAPRPGAVLVWEPIIDGNGATHAHIGFALGDNQAVSNNSFTKTPTVHHLTFNEENSLPKRKITAVYWHDKLNNQDSVSPSPAC